MRGEVEAARSRAGALVRVPAFVVIGGGEVPPRGVPYERATREGDLALSYATWTCPPTCIEPAVCPKTRGPKDWSLARDLEAPRPGDPFDERIVLPCLHLAWGVGTIPVARVRSARGGSWRGCGGGRGGLVATSSLCHALATALLVASAAAASA